MARAARKTATKTVPPAPASQTRVSAPKTPKLTKAQKKARAAQNKAARERSATMQAAAQKGAATGAAKAVQAAARAAKKAAPKAAPKKPTPKPAQAAPAQKAERKVAKRKTTKSITTKPTNGAIRVIPWIDKKGLPRARAVNNPASVSAGVEAIVVAAVAAGATVAAAHLANYAGLTGYKKAGAIAAIGAVAGVGIGAFSPIGGALAATPLFGAAAAVATAEMRGRKEGTVRGLYDADDVREATGVYDPNAIQGTFNPQELAQNYNLQGTYQVPVEDRKARIQGAFAR